MHTLCRDVYPDRMISQSGINEKTYLYKSSRRLRVRNAILGKNFKRHQLNWRASLPRSTIYKQAKKLFTGSASVCMCGICGDDKIGYMKPDEERFCCKQEGWTTINFDGIFQFSHVNLSVIAIFRLAMYFSAFYC